MKQKIFFEKHYVNYAWVLQDNGFLIDSLGNIHRFDLVSKTTNRRINNWIYPDSLGYISKSDMDKNMSICDSVISKIQSDSLAYYIGKIWKASKGIISKPDMQMADFGEIRYSAYIYDDKTNRYKEVLIKLYGDMMSNNNSSEANQIYEWMNRIGNKSH
ncbi:MAG: hypothetical protein WCK78_18650 [Paludibacter sp.]